MTVTKIQTVAAAVRRACIWRLVMAVRNWRTWRILGYQTVMLPPGTEVRIGVVPYVDEDEDEDEAMAFHANPARLTVDEDGSLNWDWGQIESPDLGEDWKTYAEWLPVKMYVN
jgi:hypothetical protein